jgi:hypothetical protein
VTAHCGWIPVEEYDECPQTGHFLGVEAAMSGSGFLLWCIYLDHFWFYEFRSNSLDVVAVPLLSSLTLFVKGVASAEGSLRYQTNN